MAYSRKRVYRKRSRVTNKNNNKNSNNRVSRRRYRRTTRKQRNKLPRYSRRLRKRTTMKGGAGVKTGVKFLYVNIKGNLYKPGSKHTPNPISVIGTTKDSPGRIDTPGMLKAWEEGECSFSTKVATHDNQIQSVLDALFSEIQSKSPKTLKELKKNLMYSSFPVDNIIEFLKYNHTTNYVIIYKHTNKQVSIIYPNITEHQNSDTKYYTHTIKCNSGGLKIKEMPLTVNLLEKVFNNYYNEVSNTPQKAQTPPIPPHNLPFTVKEEGEVLKIDTILNNTSCKDLKQDDVINKVTNGDGSMVYILNKDAFYEFIGNAMKTTNNRGIITMEILRNVLWDTITLKVEVNLMNQICIYTSSPVYLYDGEEFDYPQNREIYIEDINIQKKKNNPKKNNPKKNNPWPFTVTSDGKYLKVETSSMESLSPGNYSKHLIIGDIISSINSEELLGKTIKEKEATLEAALEEDTITMDVFRSVSDPTINIVTKLPFTVKEDGGVLKIETILDITRCKDLKQDDVITKVTNGDGHEMNNPQRKKAFYKFIRGAMNTGIITMELTREDNPISLTVNLNNQTCNNAVLKNYYKNESSL